MCGILVSISFNSSSAQDLIPYISSRGPDSLQTHHVRLPNLELSFTSSVLHLRGETVTVQPLVSEKGDVLCWNGEICQGLDIPDNENDGVKLLQALAGEESVWKVMEILEG